MSLTDRALAALPVAIGTCAVAGLVHFGTILAYPNEIEDDAFSRVVALSSVGTKTDLPANRRTRLPFRDAAMATVVCRFDLGNGPFRIVAPAFDRGFLSFGFYDRRDLAFSGLNLHDNAGGTTTLVLLTEDQKTARDAAEANGDDDASLSIVAPGRQGFALIEAPFDARAALDAVTCQPATAGEGKTDR